MRVRRNQILIGGAHLLIWLLVAVPAALIIFQGSAKQMTVASHDVVVRPSFDGYATIHSGPVLPDLRLPVSGPIGVDLVLGKTEAGSLDELYQRYAVIAAQPSGEIAKVQAAVQRMFWSSLLRGAAIGAIPIGAWYLVGRKRRADLWARRPRLIAAAASVGLLAVMLWQPWTSREVLLDDQATWEPLVTYVGVPMPQDMRDELGPVQIRSDVTTSATKRLIESSLDTYQTSKAFYAKATRQAASLMVRAPQSGETVALLVSDRHDNIGMDAVARAIGDRAGATVVLNAGDDTSSGQPWEAFSLDSVSDAMQGLDRFAVAGNHDNGSFVSDRLASLGWQVLNGKTVAGPGGGTLLGVSDPRSSGLGNWRDETGLSFNEQRERLADAACAAREPIDTILVHDAASGSEALRRGCVRLVIGGHLHVKVGPKQVRGTGGNIGYSFTTGTTGGAAYAIAIGSKPKREAMVTLITYDTAGRPIGLQVVRLQTNGVFTVEPWFPLTFEADAGAPLTPGRAPTGRS